MSSPNLRIFIKTQALNSTLTLEGKELVRVPQSQQWRVGPSRS